MKIDLSGKVAIVTGASKGIGRSIAEHLAAAGARVCVSSRDLAGSENVKRSIVNSGGHAIAVSAHAGDPQALKHLVDQTMEHLGGLDIIVNNAATNPVFGPVEDTSEVAFDKIMSVNVRGPFTLAKLAFPHFKNRGSGCVINIGSSDGHRPEQSLGIYGVSKAALASMTQVLAKEWGPFGIRVNCVSPGLVKTKFSEVLWDSEGKINEVTGRTPLRRIALPDEIAPLVVFLASEKASGFSTGGVFTADGGITL